MPGKARKRSDRHVVEPPCAPRTCERGSVEDRAVRGSRRDEHRPGWAARAHGRMDAARRPVDQEARAARTKHMAGVLLRRRNDAYRARKVVQACAHRRSGVHWCMVGPGTPVHASRALRMYHHSTYHPCSATLQHKSTSKGHNTRHHGLLHADQAELPSLMHRTIELGEVGLQAMVLQQRCHCTGARPVTLYTQGRLRQHCRAKSARHPYFAPCAARAPLLVSVRDQLISYQSLH